MTERPKVIRDLLAVDDTGVVASYIRQLEAALESDRELLVRADSYLSLLWHRHVPPDRKPFDLQMDVERTIQALRERGRTR